MPEAAVVLPAAPQNAYWGPCMGDIVLGTSPPCPAERPASRVPGTLAYAPAGGPLPSLPHVLPSLVLSPLHRACPWASPVAPSRGAGQVLVLSRSSVPAVPPLLPSCVGPPPPGRPRTHGCCEALWLPGSFVGCPRPRGSSQCPLPGHWRSSLLLALVHSVITSHLCSLFLRPQMSAVFPHNSSLKSACHVTSAFP